MTALVVVGEPLAEERWTELPREGRRHRRAGDELRLARRRQLVLAGPRNQPNASKLVVCCW